MGKRVYECAACGVALTDENRAPKRSICIPCRRKGSRDARAEWRANRDPRQLSGDRRRWLLARYGLDEASFLALLDKQGGGCAICARDLEPGRTKFALAVDHDHACCAPNWRGERRTKSTCGECVRGILCGPCNRGIGQLQDDPELLEKAAAYLRQYADRKVD